MDWFINTWRAMTADGKGGVVATLVVFALPLTAFLIRKLWLFFKRPARPSDIDAVRELAKMELAEKRAANAAKLSAHLEVRFLRGGEYMRIMNRGPSQAWDVGLNFPEGGETSILDPEDSRQKFTHCHLETGESVDVLCTINEQTPQVVPALFVWTDNGGAKQETRALRLPTNPTNLSVKIVRDSSNDLHLLVRNGGPGAASDVMLSFPGGEPIMKQMEGIAFAVIEPEQEVEVPFQQYLEHAFQAVYSVKLSWKDTHQCTQEFHVAFPRR